MLFQGSTTLDAKKLLRAQTLQSGLTRVYGWPRVIMLVLTAKKIIDAKVNNIENYFISHTKRTKGFKMFIN